MTVFTEGPHAGGYIVSEPDTNLSRKRVVIASGSGKLVPGQILGKVTSSGEFTKLAPGASDGSQVAAAILFDHVDATSADVEAIAHLKLTAVNAQEIVWPSGINDGQKAAAVAQLAALDITVIDPAGAVRTVGATQLTFHVVPAGGDSGTNLGEVTVRIENDDGTLISGDNTTSVALAKGIGSGTLTVTGGSPKVAVNGVATFAGVQFSAADTYTLVASASGLTSATSANIVVEAP